MFDWPHSLCLLILVVGLLLSSSRAGNAGRDGERLFPMDLPASQWVEFAAEGFTRPACGVIYRLREPATNGMPLGGIDVGCIDLETSGLFGYCTIFNSHVPRRGPLNLPFLGISVGGKTWVLCDNKPKPYETTDGRQPVEPVLMDLELDGVELAREIHYWGHYPVADLEYETDSPVSVGLRAWAPFIPGDIANSVIPAIVFEVRVRNAGGGTQQGTVAFSFPGPTQNEAGPARVSRQHVRGGFNGVAVAGEKAGYAIGVIGRRSPRLGGPLNADGPAWAAIAHALPSAAEGERGASAAVDFSLGPGESDTIRFLLTWCSPQWKGGGHPSSAEGNTFTHMYALRYPDPVKTARRLSRDHKRLLERILAWQQAIHASEELPVWLRESLVNNLHMIAECGMWAAAKPPIPKWVKPRDGLFGMNECPRGCPQIECIPCSFYGNIPLVYFFPQLALSSLRGYKGYQYPEGAAVWIFGGVTGKTPPVDFACPTRGYQTTLNGPCYVDMLDRYLLCHDRGKRILREFYRSVKKNTVFTVNLRPEYEIGDRIISMPSGNVGTEWFEAPEPGWFGMVPHVGGIHLANLRMSQRMAEAVGDEEFAQQCREWIEAGMTSMETKMWAGTHYLTFWEPETGKKCDLVFGYQLDGQWMAKFHGLPGVFRDERVKATLATIRRANVALSKSGATNYAHADGTPAPVGGYGTYSYFPPEVLMLAMTYMYEGEREFGIDLARRCWENIVCKWRYTWDMPNIMRGDADTGERTYGHDYYQDMMLWSLPAAMQGGDLSAPLKPGGLVDRVLHAARGHGTG